MDLTSPIVCMAVKGWHYSDKAVLFGSFAERTIMKRLDEGTHDVVAEARVTAISFHHVFGDGQGIFHSVQLPLDIQP